MIKLIHFFCLFFLVFIMFLSCALINLEPELVASVYFAESESDFGVFGLGVQIENLGYGEGVDIEYDLYLFGSADLIILYSFDYAFCDIKYEVNGKDTITSSFIGAGNVYIPFYYDLFITWYDTSGTEYGPIWLEGSFIVDFSSTLPYSQPDMKEKKSRLKDSLETIQG